ncbi:unnamed protein product [Kuraishia capsulata CBS 1993]|uniref:GATA-type domain-containing protein n=1 Tax=Kuraishia capsulata CBS 1993 TaxID=1382522 RepID=W6MIY2_9ASCO|nr:uncharacterized protein KUCA_T00002431001 [Kuraishia capsulata CBS 1993]CDK26459.1 unnamed protein product [Kuraishia capsulata CBS 1993]
MIANSIRILPSISSLTNIGDPMQHPSPERGHGNLLPPIENFFSGEVHSQKRIKLEEPGKENEREEDTALWQAKQKLAQAIDMIQSSSSENVCSSIDVVKSACGMLEDYARSLEKANGRRALSDSSDLPNQANDWSNYPSTSIIATTRDHIPRGPPPLPFCQSTLSVPSYYPFPSMPQCPMPGYFPYPLEQSPIMPGRLHPISVQHVNSAPCRSPSNSNIHMNDQHFQTLPNQCGQHFDPQQQTEQPTRRRPVCQKCGITETPEWRGGPNGSRTLCNACGLFLAKLSKRMGEQAATADFFAGEQARGRRRRTYASHDSKKRL